MIFFHFLRPEYLFLLLPAWMLIRWLLKQQSDEKKWQRMIEPKLLEHLLVPSEQNGYRLAAPWHLGLVMSLIIVAISGPSWKLKESPFTQDDTKIALLVSVKESMLTKDIQPNRLARAGLKIADLLKQRLDTQCALIAYSGSAHLVLPLTKDKDIMQTFTQALSPEIMPLEGDTIQDALVLAKEELHSKRSTIIVLTDAVSPSSVKLALEKGFDKSTNVIFWQLSSDELANENDFKNAASLLNAEYIKFSRDDSDVRSVSSMIDKHFKVSGLDDVNQYEDGGYLLVPLIFILMLLWSRQGFIAELWRHS